MIKWISLVGVILPALMMAQLAAVAGTQEVPADKPAGETKPVVLIQAYYPLNSDHRYIKDYLEKFAKSKGDTVRLEFYDMQTSEGRKAWMKTGLGCAGVFINGKTKWEVKKGEKTEEVDFIKRMDVFWLRSDFESVVNQLLSHAGKAKAASSATAAEQARTKTVTLYVPCVLSGPLMKVLAVYETQHPEADIVRQTYKPSELPSRPKGPAAVVTAGDVEMVQLVKRGLVDQAEVRAFATNTYLLAVIAATGAAPALRKTGDLAETSVKRILLDDPAKSSLGAAAKQALTKLGLWAKVQRKIAYPRPGTMLPADLIAKKAEAAIVFKDCLLEAGKPPKTIRIVGELPLSLYSPILYQIAPMKGAGRDTAQRLVGFLTGEEGRQALRKAGLRPTS